MPRLVPRPLRPPSEVSIKEMGEYKKERISLGAATFNDRDEWLSFLSDANSSSRMCLTEGAEETLPAESLVMCEECGQTTSAADASRAGAYEKHAFGPVALSSSRVDPSVFRSGLLKFLPMQVCFTGFNLDGLKPEEVGTEDWLNWTEYVKRTLTSSENAPVEFRLSRVIRSRIWTAVYEAQGHGRLEARISSSGVTWLLFAKSLAKLGKLKKFLDRPFARLDVTAPTDKTTFDMLTGKWEVLLPVEQVVTVVIAGL